MLTNNFLADKFPIEAEVRAEAQEPVAWIAFADNNGPVPLELWGFDLKACKNAILENARSIEWKGTLEGYLFQKGWSIRPLGFIAPQPPAPCQKCEETASAVRYLHAVRKMDVTEIDALQAKVTEQSAEIERLTNEVAVQAYWGPRWEQTQATIAQQAERIAELEEESQEFLTIIDKIGKAVDYDFGGGLAELVVSRLTEQTALIEKCEHATSGLILAWELLPVGKHDVMAVDAWLAGPMLLSVSTLRLSLAAIAAHKAK